MALQANVLREYNFWEFVRSFLEIDKGFEPPLEYKQNLNTMVIQKMNK